MNCHEHSKEGQTSHKHSSLKHILHMAICCGLPILVIALLPIISRVSPSASGVIAFIVPFLCPIMMILMLPRMLGGNMEIDSCQGKKDESYKRELVKSDKH